MHDDFMMDFENACLQHYWDSSQRSHPKGPRRFEDPQWAAMMRQQCQEHSDVTFEQYCEWCLAGGGDEWFQEEEEDETMEGNFYDTWQPDSDGDTFESELSENKRLLELYRTRLQYLRARDPRLELVRANQTHLYEMYEQHFLEKIRIFEADVAAIERRMQRLA